MIIKTLIIIVFTILSSNCFSYGLTPQGYTTGNPKQKTYMYKISNPSKKTLYIEVITEKVKLRKDKLYTSNDIIHMIQKSYDYDNPKVGDAFNIYPKSRRFIVKQHANKTVMVKITKNDKPYVYFLGFKDSVPRNRNVNKNDKVALSIKEIHIRGGYIINTVGKKGISVENKGKNTFQISNNEQGVMGLKIVCNNKRNVDFFIKEKTTLLHNFDNTCKVNEIKLITSGYDKIW